MKQVGELLWKKASEQDKIIARDGSFVDIVEGVLKRGKDYNLKDQHYGLPFQNNEDNAYTPDYVQQLFYRLKY